MDKNRITIIILSVVLLVLINYLALNEFFDSQEEKLERSFEEGYELGVGQPEVIYKEIDGKRCEPFELLVVDVPEVSQGKVMEVLGTRKSQLLDMQVGHDQRVQLKW